MKNQTFGDNRDLLKFDLVNHIAGSGVVDRFVYVQMLTPDEVVKEEPHHYILSLSGGFKCY